jgi:hypothetical protein
VSLIGGIRRLHEHLPTHPEVHQQRIAGIGIIQGKPEVFTPPTSSHELSAGHDLGEVLGASQMATHRAGVKHLNAADATAEDVRLEAAPDDLNLGEFRHRIC